MYLGPINKMHKNVTTVSKEYIHLSVYQMAITIGLTPDHGYLRNHDVMAFLKLRLHSLCILQGNRGYFLWGNFFFHIPHIIQNILTSPLPLPP